MSPNEWIISFCEYLDNQALVYHLEEGNQTLAVLKESPIVIQLISLNESHAIPSIEEDKQLIRLWEDVWLNHSAKVQSRINVLTGHSKRVHARETNVVKLTQPELNDFLNAHHLMGTTSAKHKLGLSHNGELVAVASFGKECPIHRDGEVFRSCELIRFCNKSGTTVRGGLSKLLSHFIKLIQPDDIMTYTDNDWSAGKAFEKLGFECIDTTKPQTFYIHTETLGRYPANRIPKDLKNECIKVLNSGNRKYLLNLKDA